MSQPENLRIEKSAGKLLIQAPGDGSFLHAIRRLVSDLAGQVGFSEAEVAKIEMAVDEACSNVLEHSYAPNKNWCWQHREPEIRLSVAIEDERLVIEINDHGQGFDFSNYQPPEIDEKLSAMARSGYGVLIMRKLMDEVEYRSNDQTGNTLRLVKYLQKS